MPTLSQIYVYPVKSLGGFPVAQWPVDKTGLQYDRKWMLIDETGKFLTQRRLPKMALIKTRIEEGLLWLQAPGHDEIALPLNSQEGEEITVKIWRDECIAKSTNQQADEWLSSFLSHPCRLVYFPETQVRQVDQDYAFATDQTAFSDGFPFLIISEASLQALNQAMSLNLSMIRFRPNLVVANCESYAEDYWRQITINTIRFRLPKACSRCSVPTIDPETALGGREPLVTLARLRRWQNDVYFGQNALHDDTGVLSVGSEVHLELTGDRQPPL
jgi:uncharacterized protein YcbX